jgi:hypothetical protein
LRVSGRFNALAGNNDDIRPVFCQLGLDGFIWLGKDQIEYLFLILKGLENSVLIG